MRQIAFFFAIAQFLFLIGSTAERSSKVSRHLLAFISITSGPHHIHYRNAARNTWLIPCQKSPLCDYRFFVDIDESRLRSINDTAGVYQKVLLESLQHNDMTFRDSCSLMKRHPSVVNYGNAPVSGEFMEKKDEFGNIVPVEDYPLRRVYKIDWKICFLKWIYRNYPKEVDYHVFVEDDSFTCTQNLLYQLALVKKNHPPDYHFRAGTLMYDGFDDSSTIMDHAIAKAFAVHYPSAKLNCSVVEDAWNTSKMGSLGWSAWGNSWRHISCDWRTQLSKNFNIVVTTPDIQCGDAMTDEYDREHPGRVHLPCLRRPIILHHWAAGHLLTKDENTGREFHICEYMLLIDKIKDTSLMHLLYNNTNRLEPHYHDFSTVFLRDKQFGWHDALTKLRDEEKECELRHPNGSDVPPYYCLFERAENRKRRLDTLNYLYPFHPDNQRQFSFGGSSSYKDFFDFDLFA